MYLVLKLFEMMAGGELYSYSYFPQLKDTQKSMLSPLFRLDAVIFYPSLFGQSSSSLIETFVYGFGTEEKGEGGRLCQQSTI